MRLPRIGVTPDEGLTESQWPLPRYELKRAYVDAVLASGGAPLVLPYTGDAAVLTAYLDGIDGLLVTGGAFDVPPELFGEAPREGLGALKPERSHFELALLRGALERDLPVLGICGGMQLLNVAYGGTLYQDLERERPDATGHQQTIDRREPAHDVVVQPGTVLARTVGVARLQVNSTHHQAVSRVGTGLVASGASPDGLVEAIEDPARRFIVGVQWHPELLFQSVPPNAGLYRALVSAARPR
jgi:putative glutamine amidotransferase